MLLISSSGYSGLPGFEWRSYSYGTHLGLWPRGALVEGVYLLPACLKSLEVLVFIFVYSFERSLYYSKSLSLVILLKDSDLSDK